MANVHDFGAAGDGNTDDTAAIQHAISEGDGVLEFNKGTYRITRSLVLDLARQGYGGVRGLAGASRIVMAGPGPAIQIVGDHNGTAQPSSVKDHTWQRERFPVVADLEIVGEHDEAIGLQLQKTMQCSVSRLAVRHCKYAVHLAERNRNFVLSGSHLYDNHVYGLFFDNCNLHQIIVHGNHISYNKRAGIKSHNGDVHNLQITGNDIEYNNRPGRDTPEEGGAEISFDAPDGIISEVTIASNTIQATIQPGGANLRIRGSKKTSPRGARLITIAGNVIGSQARAIEAEHVQRLAITGNTIYDSAEWSLVARHCSGMSVGSNTIVWRGQDSDPPRDGILLERCENGVLNGLVTGRLCSGTPEQGAGITLLNCRDIAVSNCQVTDPLVRGIELEDCVRCRVSNNGVVDRRESPKMLEAIRVIRGKDNVVQNNLASGARREAIDVTARSAVLQGNVIV